MPGGVFINGTLDEQRLAVLNDLCKIPEVTVDFMLDHIVPNLGINVGRTIQDLKEKGILLDTGWRAFIGALPKDSPDDEQKVFSKMENIYQNIITSTKFKFDVEHYRSPTLNVGTCPDIAPISETNIRSRPDGCGQLKSSYSIHTSQCSYHFQDEGDNCLTKLTKRKKLNYWFDIAYVEEYKKKNSRKDLNDVCPSFTPNLALLIDLSERIENIVEFTSYHEY